MISKIYLYFLVPIVAIFIFLWMFAGWEVAIAALAGGLLGGAIIYGMVLWTD